MKTTQKDFELFKKECQKWIDQWGMIEWRVDYGHVKLKYEVDGDIKINLNGMCASIRLSTDVCESDTPKEEVVKNTAKHEVIHLLIAKITELGTKRYIDENTWETAEEETVRKLEKIIT